MRVGLFHPETLRLVLNFRTGTTFGMHCSETVFSRAMLADTLRRHRRS